MPEAAEPNHIEGSDAGASLLPTQAPSSIGAEAQQAEGSSSYDERGILPQENKPSAAVPKPSAPPMDSMTTNDDHCDPHNLHSRYVVNQMHMFQTALAEVNHGFKESCWLWFILPTAPFFVDGRERGSSTNRHFALRGDDAVKAYLRFPPRKFSIAGDKTITVSLQQNYLSIAKAILHQLRDKRNTPPRLFGDVDSPKAKSSLELFHRVATGMEDQKEIVSVCGKILALDISWKFAFDDRRHDQVQGLDLASYSSHSHVRQKNREGMLENFPKPFRRDH